MPRKPTDVSGKGTPQSNTGGWALCRVWLTHFEHGETLEERRYKLGPSNGDHWKMEYDLQEWIALGRHRELEEVWWHWEIIEENIEPPAPYMFLRFPNGSEIPQRDCWDRTWPRPW